MFWPYRSYWIIISVFTLIISLSGCATKKTPYWENTAYGTWELTSAELKKLPDISLRKILSSGSKNRGAKVQIFVKAQNLDGVAEVIQVTDSEDVLVRDVQKQKLRLKIAQITEIKSIRHIRVKPKRRTTDETVESAAEALTYTPLVPLAITTWPFLRASGLDEGKNADDKVKALIAYGGMSKKELVKYVGEPIEKYYCKDNDGDEEVWIYNKEQVLRGGRAIFIRSANKRVYYTSYHTTFFKKSKSCVQQK